MALRNMSHSTSPPKSTDLPWKVHSDISTTIAMLSIETAPIVKEKADK